MLVIGEKINICNPLVYEAIPIKDMSTIETLAILQAEAGADVLDVNLGPDISRGKEIMQKAVKTIQQNVDIPLCLNGTPEIIEAGLMVHRGRAIINGVTGDRKRMEKLLSLAREHNAEIIGMTIPEKGYAENVEEKCSIAIEIIEQAKAYGISPSNIFLDPVMSSFSIRSDVLIHIVRNVRVFKELFPEVKTLIGLSNISQGIKEKNRSIINSTALGILIGAGLDSAILNPLDKLVMDTAKTAKLLYKNHIYCDAYLCG
ncbi:MAG: dihydropteroate synthase [Desulfobacteraceae bacterium]|nr:dihydropteroate synthase [Desulfobacteraceae bacterium]